MLQDDRRVFARFQTSFPFEIQHLGAKQSNIAQCYDISAGGIGFISGTPVSPQTNLQVRLAIPDSKVPFQTVARVVWIEQIYANKWRSGLEFSNVDFMKMRRVLQTNKVF
ncbi:MAG: PilZ domain-containing protein [Candidatus Omnitrophota bacterium]